MTVVAWDGKILAADKRAVHAGYVGGTVTSLGVDCVEAELGPADHEFLARKLGIYGIEAPASWRKFVCGRKLWNYDNLEPAERKLVL